MTPDRFPFEPWIAAWAEGVRSFWPNATPNEIAQLLSVRDSLSFTAPEQWHVRCAQAWEVYCDAPEDSPIARAAVALAYIIAAARKP